MSRDATGTPPRVNGAAAAVRHQGPLVLAVDLETLAAGKREEAARLAGRLQRRPHTSVVYATTPRSLRSAQACAEALQLPDADVLIADAGASLAATREHAGLDALDATLEARWPGAREVRTRVAALEHLLGEHRWDDARRVSFFPRRGVSHDEALAAVRQALADLDVDVVSDGKRIDVLPPHTDLTTTLTQTLHALNVDPTWVVAAGGFIEPRLLNDGAYWGIATAATPSSARAELTHNMRVHFTSAEGPVAVLEGLQTLGFL